MSKKPMKRRAVKRKKSITLYSAANQVRRQLDKKSNVPLWEDLAEATTLTDEYRRAIKAANTDDQKTLNLHSDIIKLGQKFQLSEKVYKVASGLVFSTLADTMDQKSFAKMCREDFKVTAQTALRYKTIYDAWFSGKFLYSLPRGGDGLPQNPLDLSVRDLELGASLIIEGELDEDSAGVLFGEGSWLDKKDILREQKPKIIKRDRSVDRKSGKPTSKERSEKELLTVSSAGGVYYMGTRIGFLEVTASDTAIRSVALRSAEVLKGEFNA